MIEWSTAVWGAIGSAFVVGLFVGVLFTRFTNRNIQKRLQLEADLKAMNAQASEQKAQLKQHFEDTAYLLATIAEQHKNLFSHLEKDYECLLPDEYKEHFAHTANTLPEAEVKKLDNSELNVKQLSELTEGSKQQPQDYSEGSSGLFNKQ